MIIPVTYIRKNSTRLLIVAATLFPFLPVRGQSLCTFCGSKTVYQPPVHAFHAAPAGYKPVFISHTGRHGARFLTKPGADINLYRLLQYADSCGLLTRTGQDVKQMLKRFLLVEQGSYELITALGAQEQEGIGERMLQNYP